MEAKKKKACAVKLEFKENADGDECCPICGSTDVEHFMLTGCECNECGCRIS